MHERLGRHANPLVSWSCPRDPSIQSSASGCPRIKQSDDLQFRTHPAQIIVTYSNSSPVTRTQSHVGCAIIVLCPPSSGQSSLMPSSGAVELPTDLPLVLVRARKVASTVGLGPLPATNRRPESPSNLNVQPQSGPKSPSYSTARSLQVPLTRPL